MFNKCNPLRIATIGTVAIAAFAAQPAFAQSVTDNLAVSATVTENCSISTSAIAFGNVDVTCGANVDGTGGISVSCTTGTAWSATAGAGAGTGASNAVRKMTSGGNLLNYALYTDSGRTTLWGDGAGDGAAIAGTGTGSAQARTVYGRVPLGQASVPIGSYADTVVITLTY